MSKKQSAMLKAGVAGVVAGGLAFVAVNSLCSRRSHRRMTTAKALKMVGTLMDAF